MVSALFSDPGVVLASFLHTFGAIGYMGGIAFYIGWNRSLQRGHDSPTVLATGASLTYVSILANLFGGFLRTYQPGHPGLFEFGASTWVTVMAIKHVALFAGIGAAVYLFEMHAPRLRRAARDGEELAPRRQRNAQAMLSTVVASILVAAVLGGVSTVLDLGAAAAPDDSLVVPEPVEPGGPYRFEGTVMQGAPETGTFDVAPGTSRIDAVFVAAAPGGLPLDPFQFALQLRDPTGAATSGDTQSLPATDERRIELSVPAPAPGTWTYEVTSEAGVAAAYSVDITLIGSTVIEDTVTIAAGEFFEINVRADAGVVLAWDWSASDHVEWDIHTHFDGVEIVAGGHAQTDAGEYTTQQAGGHSYLWLAESDVTLTFRVWGDFVVESIVA